MITNSPYQSHLFMNNIQVAIIEDEKAAARLLEGMIKKLRPQWDIIKIPGSIESSVAWFASHPHPDIVFLDIQLSDGNSFLFIEQACPTSLIIFTTAYDEYAVRAFTVNSIDYLLKPIRQERLEEAIQKFEHVTSKYNQKLLEQNDLLEVLHSLTYPGKKYRPRFLISGNEKLITLQVEDIAYFYSLNKITFAVTRQNKEYIIDFPLDKLMEQLDPDKFFRTNRQTIINIESIVKIEPYFQNKVIVHIKPEHKEKILVSKEKWASFKLWLNY